MIQPFLRPPYHLSFVFPEHDFAYLGVAKCASTTLRNALGCTQARFSPDQTLHMSTRFAVIRHPETRIVSAWRNKFHQYPFEEYLDTVLQNPHFDVHTFPYSDLLQDYPTEIHCLEDVNLWLPEMPDWFPKSLPTSNSSQQLPCRLKQRTRNQLKVVYASDYDLWARTVRSKSRIRSRTHPSGFQIKQEQTTSAHTHPVS